MNLQQFLSEWLEVCIFNNVKRRTYAAYSDTVRLHILPALGAVEMSELTAPLIQRCLAELHTKGNRKTLGGLSGSSVGMVRSVLRLALGTAAETGVIAANPMAHVKAPRQDERKTDAFSRREQQRIEEYIASEGKPQHLGILLSLYTGIRLGELLALEYSDIDFKRGVLHITKTARYCKPGAGGEYVFVTDSPKSASSRRMIPLPKNVLALLRQARRKAKSKYVAARADGRRIPTHSYQYAFGAMLEKCRVRYRSFHTLRHTFATRALEIGIDVKTLSELMGHSSPAFTLSRYAHSMTEYKFKIMNKLGGIMKMNNEK